MGGLRNHQLGLITTQGCWQISERGKLGLRSCSCTRPQTCPRKSPRPVGDTHFQRTMTSNGKQEAENCGFCYDSFEAKQRDSPRPNIHCMYGHKTCHYIPYRVAALHLVTPAVFPFTLPLLKHNEGYFELSSKQKTQAILNFRFLVHCFDRRAFHVFLQFIVLEINAHIDPTPPLFSLSSWKQISRVKMSVNVQKA